MMPKARILAKGKGACSITVCQFPTEALEWCEFVRGRTKGDASLRKLGQEGTPKLVRLHLATCIQQAG
jgi:hypothetical protein